MFIQAFGVVTFDCGLKADVPLQLNLKYTLIIHWWLVVVDGAMHITPKREATMCCIGVRQCVNKVQW